MSQVWCIPTTAAAGKVPSGLISASRTSLPSSVLSNAVSTWAADRVHAALSSSGGERAREQRPDSVVLGAAGFEPLGAFRFPARHCWTADELIGFGFSTSILRHTLGSLVADFAPARGLPPASTSTDSSRPVARHRRGILHRTRPACVRVERATCGVSTGVPAMSRPSDDGYRCRRSGVKKIHNRSPSEYRRAPGRTRKTAHPCGSPTRPRAEDHHALVRQMADSTPQWPHRTPPEETSASETAALMDPAENLDEEFTPHRREGLGTVTMLLAILVLAGGGFLAGAYVQKTHTPVSATCVTRVGVAGGVGRATGRGATAAAGAGTGAAPAPTGSSTATAPPSAQAGPAVIGQIIKVTGTPCSCRTWPASRSPSP